jgi:tetratricopeptide (TPR) repeat protein
MADHWTMLKDHRQKAALHEIQADLENIRTAWNYWLQLGDVAQLKNFFHSIWAFYDIKGWYPAGIDLFEQGVQVMRANGSEEAEACLGWLLAAQGLFSVPVKDYDVNEKAGAPQPLWLATHGLFNTIGAGPKRGFSLAMTGVQILKRLGKYKELMVLPLISLFITASQIPEEHATSRQAALDTLEVAKDIGDWWAIAKANQFLAVMAIEDQAYEKARRMAGEALSAFEANGDHWSTSVVYIEVLGLLEITLQQYEKAKEWIQKGLNAALEINFKYAIQTAYWQLGYVAALEENYGEAGNYWRKALEVSDQMLSGRSFIGFGSRRQDLGWHGEK